MRETAKTTRLEAELEGLGSARTGLGTATGATEGSVVGVVGTSGEGKGEAVVSGVSAGFEIWRGAGAGAVGDGTVTSVGGKSELQTTEYVLES